MCAKWFAFVAMFTLRIKKEFLLFWLFFVCSVHSISTRSERIHDVYQLEDQGYGGGGG